MQVIGRVLRKRSQEAKDQGKLQSRGPAKGDRRQRSQRKSFKQRGHGKRRSKFGKKR
tara:strand:- start:1885 stop:2055 length:171 start_codon:yes stop_codon:yes gene_type:complete